MIDEHWIVVERSTDRAIFETWNPKLVAAIDKTRYDAPHGLRVPRRTQ